MAYLMLAILLSFPSVIFAAVPPQASTLAKLPIPFEPNRGQAPATARFLAHAQGYSILIRPNGVIFQIPTAGGSPRDVEMSLRNAATPQSISGERPLEGISSYFDSPDQTKWIRAVPHYSAVKLTRIYPGIDLIYYGSGSTLEYDFHVQPGARPDAIAFTLSGAKPTLKNGDLLLSTPAGDIVQRRPVAWQEDKGKRIPVAASFDLRDNEVRFRLGPYRKDLKLIIDPAIQWSSTLPRLPGFLSAFSAFVTVGDDGATYMTGGHRLGLSDTSAYVCKINPAGTAIAYIASFSNATPAATAVDAEGAVYLGGSAGPAFATKNAMRPSPVIPSGVTSSGTEAFVAKLNPTGGDLVYSTFVGGQVDDFITALAVDAAGALYIGGSSNSTDFPNVNSQFSFVFYPNSPIDNSKNAFVAKIAPNGQSYNYATFLGGPVGSIAGLAVDSAGRLIVNGTIADQGSFPIRNPLASVQPGSFVARLSAKGDLELGTGLAATIGEGIARDSQNNIYFIATIGSGYGVYRISADLKSLSTIANIPGLFRDTTNFFWRSPRIAIGAGDAIYVLAAANSSLVPVRPMMTLAEGRLGTALVKMTTSGSIIYSTFLSDGLLLDARHAPSPDGGVVVSAIGTTSATSSPIPFVNPILIPSAVTTLSSAFVVNIADTPDAQLPLINVSFNATAALANPGLEISVDGIKFAADSAEPQQMRETIEGAERFVRRCIPAEQRQEETK